MAIDKRKNYYITLDTEACNTDVDDMRSSLVYDLGFAVHDKNGNIEETRDFVLYEIYAKEKSLMQSAYYADKLPQYEAELANGTRKMVSVITAYYEFRRLCEKYNVKAVIAHNARFDLNALNATMRYVTKSKIRYFFPKNVEIWDTQKMAHDTICKQKSYIRFCQENGFMTKHKTPRVRETAEALHAYRTLNPNYKECHTALEDVLIEMQIFTRCLAQHKKMRKTLFA